MKTISVLTPCYNEELCIEDIYLQVREVFAKLEKYTYEHIFIDNSSTDRTVPILKEIAKNDKNVRIIVNARNVGSNVSAQHGLLQTEGDAVIIIAADLQDPPPMIVDFIRKWEEGFKIAIAIKSGSDENRIMSFCRNLYYYLAKRFADIDHITNFTGYGLYDRDIIEILRRVSSQNFYFRGFIAEIGFERAEIKFSQPKRRKGESKVSLLASYDTAMLGIVNHSKVPLRISTFVGSLVGLLSLLLLVIYVIWKIIVWRDFELGMAPLIIGVYFFAAVQLFFIGIIGEYIGAIYMTVQKRPLVFEIERVNFDEK